MSNLVIHSVNDINMSKETWRIEVRLLRLWTNYYKNSDKKSSIEIVCQDEKEGQIQASLPHFLFDKFEKRLEEGKCYRLNNFHIQKNEYMRATSHEFKLQFHKSTGVRQIEKQLNIPRNNFKIVEINDILSGEIGANQLFDVVAQLVACAVLNDDTKGKIRTTATLKDDLGESINCTFWTPFAEDIVNRWSKAIETPQGPIVLIVQHAMVQEYRGFRSIANSMYASKLFFDETIPEIAEFKSKLNGSHIERSFTVVSSSSNNSTDDFEQKLDFKRIEELDVLSKEGWFYVHGRIVKIATSYNWFYIGCKAHNIKVDESMGKTCPKCKNEAILEPRFKLTVQVEDDSGIGHFVLFDDQIFPIVKKTALQLKQELEEEEEYDSFPDVLDEMIGRKCVFKIEVQKYNLSQKVRTFTIRGMSEDSIIISRIAKGKEAVVEGKNLSPYFDEIASFGECSVQTEFTTPSQKRDHNQCIDVDSYDYQHSVTSKILKIKEEKF